MQRVNTKLYNLGLEQAQRAEAELSDVAPATEKATVINPLLYDQGMPLIIRVRVCLYLIFYSICIINSL